MRASIAFCALVGAVAAQSSARVQTTGSVRLQSSGNLEPTVAPSSIGDVEPTASASVSGPIQTARACAQIADAVGRTSATYPSVQAEIALACLKSVPIVRADANFTVYAIKQMAEFQSTIAYLKKPPAGWPNDAVDIMAGLDDINTKVNNRTYTNEYDFEVDIASLFIKAHDGHLNFNGMAYAGAFRWRRSSAIALISASRDGNAPKVYAFHDFNNTANTNISPITQINGRDVVQFLNDEAKMSAYHDPDTRYNALFFLQPAESYGYFTSPRFYPGPSTSVTFENGTSRNYTNAALVLQPRAWRYISDPETFYETYIEPTTSSKRVKARNPNALPMNLENPRDHEFKSHFSILEGSVDEGNTPMFYPSPFVAHSAADVALAGFFINTGNGQIGILVIQTFNTDDAAGAREFQRVVQQYIAQSKAQGVTKHIIDVRTNGGGKVLSGYDTYLQFFPSQKPQTQSRYRGSKASELFGESISSYTTITTSNAELFTSPFSNDAYISSNLSKFADWKAMYPPETFNGDKFTTLLKYNLSDPLTTSNTRLSVGITVTGYNDRANFTTDPFRAQDIILLSDGICASTCSIFTELLVQQSGVRTLAVGGRPQTGPMQPVGGTKGTLVLPARYLQSLSSYVVQNFATSRTQQREWAAFVPNPFAIAASDASVNFQDNIRAGLEKDGVPSQFLNDTASCRIWYAPEMYTNVTRLWEKVANVAFGGKDGALDEAQCVAGSVTKREQQTGQGAGNAPANGTGSGKKSSAARIGGWRSGWGVVWACAVVVIGSWMVI